VLYKALKIPVCVAADLDVIRELGTFRKILEAVAPAEDVNELMQECTRIIAQVKALGPMISESETREQLSSILESNLRWTEASQLNTVRRELDKVSFLLSPTARLKQGMSSLKGEAVYTDLTAFLHRCRGVGVFLVPVGVLEDWVPDLASSGPNRKKKAEWATYVAGRIRESVVRDNDVWDFVDKMARFQRDEGARLAGYPSEP
jgi:hypothetical protein